MSATFVLKRRIDAEHIPATGLDVSVETDAGQRDALAKAYDLVAVKALSATSTLIPGRRGSVAVEGRVIADVVQSCVVTLVPVDQHIDEPFSVRFVPANSPEVAPPKPGAEVVIDPAAPDPPEIMDDAIDIGRLVEEVFALAIDPYPRAPDAALPTELTQAGEKAGESPFAVLAKARPKDG